MSDIFTPFSAEIDKMALIKWEEEYAKEIGIRQINELLSGKKLSTEEYKEMAETNIKETLKASAFSLKEKQDFYKKKWLKDHIAIMVFFGVCIIGVFVAGIVCRNSLVSCAAMLLLVLAHCRRNNTKMAYVERNAFDGTIIRHYQ